MELRSSEPQACWTVLYHRMTPPALNCFVCFLIYLFGWYGRRSPAPDPAIALKPTQTQELILGGVQTVTVKMTAACVVKV
jgi:hypothetical protein